jgi:hypothetical protein
MADLALARGEKQAEQHGVIDEAYADRADVGLFSAGPLAYYVNSRSHRVTLSFQSLSASCTGLRTRS